MSICQEKLLIEKVSDESNSTGMNYHFNSKSLIDNNSISVSGKFNNDDKVGLESANTCPSINLQNENVNYFKKHESCGDSSKNSSKYIRSKEAVDKENGTKITSSIRSTVPSNPSKLDYKEIKVDRIRSRSRNKESKRYECRDDRNKRYDTKYRRSRSSSHRRRHRYEDKHEKHDRYDRYDKYNDRGHRHRENKRHKRRRSSSESSSKSTIKRERNKKEVKNEIDFATLRRKERDRSRSNSALRVLQVSLILIIIFIYFNIFRLRTLIMD